MPILAAAYPFGLVTNHPYRDGNRRIGFLAMVTFLGVNDYDFDATESEVVAECLALARLDAPIDSLPSIDPGRTR